MFNVAVTSDYVLGYLKRACVWERSAKLLDYNYYFEVLQYYSLTLVLFLSIFWLSFTFVELLVGGTVPAIFSAYVRLPINALLKKPLKPIDQKIGVAFNFVILFLYLVLITLGISSGSLESSRIVSFFTSTFFLVFWALSSVGLSLQAGVPAKTGNQISNLASFSAFFLTVPALIATIYVPDIGRENYVFWSFILGTALGVFSAVTANVVVIPKRYKEMAILERSNSISEKLEPMHKVLTIIRSFPRFVRTRREIMFLIDLHRTALQAVREGDYDTAIKQFEIIDYEHPRVSARLEVKIRDDFRREIDDQLNDLAKRAGKISSSLSDGNLLEAIRAVESEIESLKNNSELVENWDFESVFQGKADVFSGLVARLDRLAALAESIDADSIMTAWDFDPIAVQETIAIASALQVDSSALTKVFDNFQQQTQSIQKLDYDSYAELRSAMETTGNLVEESKSELEKLSASIANQYNFESYDNEITVIFPRYVKKDEEGKIAVLVRGIRDQISADAIKAEHSSSGFTFLEGDRTTHLDGGDFVLIETIFRPSSKRKNTFRTSLSFDSENKIEHSSVNSIYVAPPPIDLFSEAGVIAAGVTALAALVLYGVSTVSDLVIEQSTIGVISAFCGFMYLLYSIVKIRMERNTV